ncbi:DUF3363 domain-containing protein [Pseudomonas aeruginosa]|uniref:DUF3363 domain-containing protein n=1 Tax=Pseudomonas aeruginosa TaxID=287 RepID=UPI00383AD5C2
MGKGDDDFRIRPGAPKQRGDSFIRKALRQASKAGAKAGRSTGKSGGRPGARLGRGHVAARFAGSAKSATSRRAAVKIRLVNLAKAGPRSTATHLRYIEREGVDRDGGRGQAYGPMTDNVDLAAFEEKGREDRHQFRMIVSPEDAAELDDLRSYTRHLMERMESDLGTRLDWVAVDHWNTDNPHTHVVVRGKDDTGKDLIISRDYISHGLRERASELATQWLGPRTELEIQQAQLREVAQERWTGLDRALQRDVADGMISLERLNANPANRQRSVALVGRLQHLQGMGLASESEPGVWTLHPEAEATLRTMGERGDIIRTMQRAMSGRQCDFSVFEPSETDHSLTGRVAGKGLAGEFHDQAYLIVDGMDGKAHYVTLPPRADLKQYPTGTVVEIKGSTAVRAADKTIAALAVDGLYSTEKHLASVTLEDDGRDPREHVEAHVRRLEALRRANIVERLENGDWRVPADLPERGRQYDARRLGGGVAVELKSHLPIERQAHAIGATWLDRKLLDDDKGLGDSGFAAELKQALRERTDFLEREGLAERRGQRVLLARNLLATLRNRELARAAQDIAADTGLEHRAVADGERVRGIYRRSVMLTSGRYAMLDDGMGFSLVPWRPVIEPKLGQELSATVRGGGVSWVVGRQRGPSIA